MNFLRSTFVIRKLTPLMTLSEEVSLQRLCGKKTRPFSSESNSNVRLSTTQSSASQMTDLLTGRETDISSRFFVPRGSYTILTEAELNTHS